MKTISLNGSDWKLTGVWPNSSRMAKSHEIQKALPPLIPTMAAQVPGAVQLDLMANEELADINVGLQSRQAEWVENWEWVYTKTLVVPEAMAHHRVFLQFDGLDYAGRVVLDGNELGSFCGTHIPHRFEITDVMKVGQEQTLCVVFDPAPRLPGQLAYTWQVTVHKPRFNYIWDWVARSVSLGIWGDVALKAYRPVWMEKAYVNPTLDESGVGRIRCNYHLHEAPDGLRDASIVRPLSLYWELRTRDHDGHLIASGNQEVKEGVGQLHCATSKVRPWFPNGLGAQPLYTFRVELRDGEGISYDCREFPLGFVRLAWEDNEGAPAGARPAKLRVNGTELFLRGVNWVPLSSFFGGVTREEYRERLRQYKAMHVNVIRIWGGGIFEKRDFYELCDELGLFVWQEMPLSSGGLSDYPPDDVRVIADLAEIAEHNVEARCHHVCHLLWCGGNELAMGLDGDTGGRERPVDIDHPLIGEFARVCHSRDPDKKFIPTSGHGPRAFAHERDYGKGLHHDVHGPWGYLGPEAHYTYFNADDALWRSELGVPGYTSIRLLQQNNGGYAPWPINSENKLWLHHGSWWIQTALMEQMFGSWDAACGQPSDTAKLGDGGEDEGEGEDEGGPLRQHVNLSRYLQAEGYRYAVESCRRRAMQCSLVTIWMGHDCFWTTANNSVIEYDGSPKPAYSFLQRSWATAKVSLAYDGLCMEPHKDHRFSVWLHRDEPTGFFEEVSVTAVVRELGGAALSARTWRLGSTRMSEKIGDMVVNLPLQDEGLVFVEVTLGYGEQSYRDVYIFGQDGEHVLRGLRWLPPAELQLQRTESEDGTVLYTVTNTGDVAAVMVELVLQEAGSSLVCEGNAVTLFPNQSSDIQIAYPTEGVFALTALNYAT